MTTANNNKIACDVCGSTNIVQSEKERYLPIPYGQPALIHQSLAICPDCGSEIDSTKDEENRSAIETALHNSIKPMLDHLINLGYSLAQIERALDLPQRTISRWRGSGELSSIGIALLRILRTYPWIIEVAENKYDEYFSKTMIISAAAEGLLQLKQLFYPSVTGLGYVQVTATEENQNVFAIFSKDINCNPNNIKPIIQQIGTTS